MKKIKLFKIRCSAIGQIMSDSGMITPTQLIDLDKLLYKEKPRTAKQEVDMQKLIFKRDNPQISQGAKTYCQLWVKEVIYGSRKEFSSKEILKGLINEDEGIDLIADYLKVGFLVKNEEQFSDDWMTGEPDVLPDEVVIDNKCSWDCFTFPLFETEIPDDKYYWQLQGYMNLANRNKAKLIYTLTDTPTNIINSEATRHSYNLGYGGLDMEIYKKFHTNMTYKYVPNRLKVKCFDIERNDADIQKIKDRVEMCRDYITWLIKQI